MKKFENSDAVGTFKTFINYPGGGFEGFEGGGPVTYPFFQRQCFPTSCAGAGAGLTETLRNRKWPDDAGYGGRMNLWDRKTETAEAVFCTRNHNQNLGGGSSTPCTARPHELIDPMT